MLRLLFIFAFLFALPFSTYAATTYETSAPLSEQLIDFPYTPTGSTSVPYYDIGYVIPQGTQFDRIQMSVPSSQGTYSKTLSASIYNHVGSEWFYSCINDNCGTDDTLATSLTVSSHTEPQDGTLQWVFSTTTTITTATQYFRFYFDPNSPYVDFSYNGTPNQPYAASMNGYAYTKSLTVPTLKFCNGACDNNSFSPVPNVTASPWARIVSPVANSTHEDTIPLVVQDEACRATLPVPPEPTATVPVAVPASK